MNPGMVLEKELDLLTFVPSGAVNIEVDGVTAERSQQMPENKEKSNAVAFICAYESFLTQQGCDPSG